MTNEKFKSEVDTLKKFYEKHCWDKHTNHKSLIKTLEYKGIKYDVELKLCQECHDLIDYSFDRLKNCPYEIKPKCRTCPAPCYDKLQWKQVAKLMRYSGMQFGLLKIRKFFARDKK
jgi:predicted amidophosphoribosyltransferase